MEVKFIKMNPTQNMTILVESPVAKNRHKKVARELMDYASVYAEQVGYIENPTDSSAWARLQMMGGEFCGNATMSLAALLTIDRNLPKGVKCVIPVECSGAEGPITVTAVPGDVSVKCFLEMPRPKSVAGKVMKSSGRRCPATVVDLGGITHFVVPEEAVHGDKFQWAEKAIQNWAVECRSEALGIILHQREDNSITPLVHVKDTGSLVWERGCGSGTAALGAALAHEARKSISAQIAQPGGHITVRADFRNGEVAGVSISAQVKLVARGVAYLNI